MTIQICRLKVLPNNLTCLSANPPSEYCSLSVRIYKKRTPASKLLYTARSPSVQLAFLHPKPDIWSAFARSPSTSAGLEDTQTWYPVLDLLHAHRVSFLWLCHSQLNLFAIRTSTLCVVRPQIRQANIVR